jgi:hypothetical protein
MGAVTGSSFSRLFDWAKFRRTKEAVELHLLLDDDGYLPSFALDTQGNVSDVKVARQFHFDPGTIVVDDRGITIMSYLAGELPKTSLLSHASRITLFIKSSERKKFPKTPVSLKMKWSN